MTSGSFINKYLMVVSHMRLGIYCPNMEFELGKTVDLKQLNLSAGGQMYQMRLEEPSFRITTRLYYAPPVAIRWACHKLKMTEKAMTAQIADDFMKEFLNFYGGHIRTLYDYTKFKVNMKPIERFPFEPTGFAAILNSQDPAVNIWGLGHGTDVVAMASRVEILNKIVYDQNVDNVIALMEELDIGAVKVAYRIGMVEPLDE